MAKPGDKKEDKKDDKKSGGDKKKDDKPKYKYSRTKVTCTGCKAIKAVRPEVYMARVKKIQERDSLTEEKAEDKLQETYLCQACRPKASEKKAEAKAKKDAEKKVAEEKKAAEEKEKVDKDKKAK